MKKKQGLANQKYLLYHLTSGIWCWTNHSIKKSLVSSSPDFLHRVVVRINWNVCYRNVHFNIWHVKLCRGNARKKTREKSENYTHSRYSENRSIRKQIELKEQNSKYKILCVCQACSDNPRKAVLFRKWLNFNKAPYHLQSLPSQTEIYSWVKWAKAQWNQQASETNVSSKSHFNHFKINLY